MDAHSVEFWMVSPRSQARSSDAEEDGVKRHTRRWTWQSRRAGRQRLRMPAFHYQFDFGFFWTL